MIGFDCGGQRLNVTTLSLVDIDDCQEMGDRIRTENRTIALYEQADFDFIVVKQCKILIHRVVQSCAGWFNYVKAVENAEADYMLNISPDDCYNLHITKTFKLDYTKIITGLKINETITRPMVFAGDAKDNKCHGAFYSDEFGSFNDVFVQGQIHIRLSEVTAQVDLRNNKLKLPSGTMCSFNDHNCIDFENGNSFWQGRPNKGEINNQYQSLH